MRSGKSSNLGDSRKSYIRAAATPPHMGPTQYTCNNHILINRWIKHWVTSAICGLVLSRRRKERNNRGMAEIPDKFKRFPLRRYADWPYCATAGMLQLINSQDFTSRLAVVWWSSVNYFSLTWSAHAGEM